MRGKKPEIRFQPSTRPAFKDRPFVLKIGTATIRCTGADLDELQIQIQVAKQDSCRVESEENFSDDNISIDSAATA